MKYYKEVFSDEHYLNCYELACRYRILTKNDKPHSRFVARFIKEYKLKNNITETYYYRTPKGDMMMVYPKEFYEPLFAYLLEAHEKRDVLYAMAFDNKNHYFKIKEAIE